MRKLALSDEILMKVDKAARYIGGEVNSVMKDKNDVDIRFEGKQYQAPGCYDRYLTQIFGDYMTLPPEEKRVDHKMKVWYGTDI